MIAIRIDHDASRLATARRRAMTGGPRWVEAPLGAGAAVLACDIGGTDTKAALFDPAGRMLGLSRTATPLRGAGTAGAVLDLVEQLAAGFARDFPDVRPAAVGLIAPGIVDDVPG